ncbi:MAG: biotin transporter BioY [Methanoregulaceae archaeon]|jgi:biotin transport system substrate-specific component|nr:biotin transporter BioY [Methanoregulaceae archaeon]
MLGDRRRSLLVSLTAANVGLIIVGSWISIPFFPVPITLQTLFVLLSGAVMRRYGAIPPLLYVLMGAMNLPVFHNGMAGIGILLGPTGGYILGFIPGALVTGLAYERRSAMWRGAGLVAGDMVILSCGTAWLCITAGLSLQAAFLLGFLPFVAGDLLKACAAFSIARRLDALREGKPGERVIPAEEGKG